MARQRDKRPARSMKRVLLVVCEGETEANYVRFLQQQYRVPIKIVAKVAGGDITQRKLAAFRKEQMIHGADTIQTFLMYDMDVSSVTSHLKTLDDAQLLLSNPCIELWFLLHSTDVHATLTSTDCIKKLKAADIAVWGNYQKSKLSSAQCCLLWKNREYAKTRALALPDETNPSSTIYKLLQALDSQAK